MGLQSGSYADISKWIIYFSVGKSISMVGCQHADIHPGDL